jgi:hypothetical protein
MKNPAVPKAFGTRYLIVRSYYFHIPIQESFLLLVFSQSLTKLLSRSALLPNPYVHEEEATSFPPQYDRANRDPTTPDSVYFFV